MGLKLACCVGCDHVVVPCVCCSLVVRLVWLVRSKQQAAVKSGWLLEIAANLCKSKLEDGEGAL